MTGIFTAGGPSLGHSADDPPAVPWVAVLLDWAIRYGPVVVTDALISPGFHTSRNLCKVRIACTVYCLGGADFDSRTGFLVPRHGTFLVFELDAVRTVELLNDPLLKVAAAQMRPQKYVGYIHRVRT